MKILPILVIIAAISIIPAFAQTPPTSVTLNLPPLDVVIGAPTAAIIDASQFSFTVDPPDADFESIVVTANLNFCEATFITDNSLTLTPDGSITGQFRFGSDAEESCSLVFTATLNQGGTTIPIIPDEVFFNYVDGTPQINNEFDPPRTFTLPVSSFTTNFNDLFTPQTGLDITVDDSGCDGFIDFTAASNRGEFDLTFTAPTDPTCTVTFTGTNTAGSMSRDLTYTVNSPENRPPSLSAIPLSELEINEGDEVNIQLSASDPDGDTVTISVFVLPDGLSFDATTNTISGIVSHTVASRDNTPRSVPTNIQVNDGIANILHPATFTVHDINSVPTDHPNSPSQQLGLTTSQTRVIELNEYFQDLDDDPLIFTHNTASSDCSASNIDIDLSDSTLTLTALNNPATCNLVIDADDNFGGTHSITLQITISATPPTVNQAAVNALNTEFTLPDSTTLDANSLFNANGNTLTFSTSGCDGFIDFTETSTGIFTLNFNNPTTTCTVRIAANYGGDTPINTDITYTILPDPATTPTPPTVNQDGVNGLQTTFTLPVSTTLDANQLFNANDHSLLFAFAGCDDFIDSTESDGIFTLDMTNPTTPTCDVIIRATFSGIEGSGFIEIPLTYTILPSDSQESNDGGNDSEWRTKPTFGKSHITGEKYVDCGYSMDGQCRDVIDYHVDYTRQEIETNSTHDFTLKAYSANGLKSFAIGFGVKSIGAPINSAEAIIHIDLIRNHTAPSTYQIDKVIYDNKNMVIGEDATFSLNKVKCLPSDNSAVCIQLDINDVLFREQMYHEPFVIHALDSRRYGTSNYLNEGLLIQGDSLNPAPLHHISKASQTNSLMSIQLTRTDKLSDIWTDQFGYTWTKNSFDTWSYVKGPQITISTACTDINKRICDVFDKKYFMHTSQMENIRDLLYGDIYAEPFANLDDAITIRDMDGDSRDKFMLDNGMMWISQ